MRNKLLLLGILAAAILARVILIRGGGQYFIFDESKIHIAGAAAALLRQGEVKAAVVYALEPHPGFLADHLGFKLVAILPEYADLLLVGKDRIPVYFFGAFSVLSILLLAAISHRLSGSRRAFTLTLGAGALSATLLIYARHLVPYDLAMAFALLTLWVGVKRPASLARSYAVGALSAWTFFCYYGYWPLAGTVVLLHLLWSGTTLPGFLKRCGLAVAGFFSVLLLMYGLSQLGSGRIIPDTLAVAGHQSFPWCDFNSAWHSWLYLFYADRIALLLWTVVFLAALFLGHRGPAGKTGLTPLRLVAVGLAVVYGIFVVDSDLRHALVVHGRHSRQLAVFLLLGFGLGADQLCARTRHWRALLAGLAGLLAANALWTFWIPLHQEFPDRFKDRAEKVLAARPPVTDGKSYYRLVNVDHYIVEPEILRAAPMETLLASRHPLQYWPFLFEGERWEVEKSRQLIDHRMRLVRMAVPAAEQVGGKPYGQVVLDLSFADNRAGSTEPLLAIGPRRNGELFFISYLGSHQAVLGFESSGVAVLRSDPFAYEPGRRYRLQLFCGSLMPPSGSIDGISPPLAEAFRQWVCAQLDDRLLLDQALVTGPAQPGEVYVGVNTVEADSAEEQFSGSVAGVVRGGPPARSPPAAVPQEYGPVELKISAPAAGDGNPQPLVVAGKPGRAVLGFVRVLPTGETRFGLEIWGVGSQESEALRLPPDEPIDVEFSFGSLYPAPGSPAWGGVPLARQQELRRTLRITVNDTVVLESRTETPDLTGLPVYLGSNPLRGSVVGADYAGGVLRGSRGSLGPGPAAR